MRLVRVSTQDKDSRFDGLLNADLSVNEGASVALKTLVLEQQDSRIQITPANNQIQYDHGATSYTATLTNGDYSSNDSNDLLVDISNQLNGTANYVLPGVGQDNKIIGMEYRGALDTAHKVQIQARKGFVGEMPNAWESENTITVTNPGPPASIWYGAPAAVADGEGRCMSLWQRMPNGNAMFEALIYEAKYNLTTTRTTAQRNGIWLCATTEDLSKVPVDDLAAAIFTSAGRDKYCQWGVGVQILDDPAPGVGGDKRVRYLSIEGGAASLIADSASTVLTQDITNPRIRLQRSANKMYACYYDKDANDSVELANSVKGLDLWQFAILWDDDNYIQIAQVQFSSSPFSTDMVAQQLQQAHVDHDVAGKVSSEYDQPQGWSSAVNLYGPDYAPTANVLAFQSLTLAQYLGFNQVRIPINGAYTNINFVATAGQRFGPRVTADSIIVLSDTWDLDSYDTYYDNNQAGLGQRRSILDVVPVDRANDGRVTYEPNTLQFIAIRNLQAEWVRNFRFRLVDGQYTPISLYGQASLVILIKERGE